MNSNPSREKNKEAVEQFGKIPKQVLAAPKPLLSLAAKVIYGVLNGERNARVGQPVHLTQTQVAVRSGVSVRTVQDALRMLERVGLISIHEQPALNGWSVHSYTVHPASRSSLPPTPDLPKTYGTHMREVLERHAQSAGSPPPIAQDAPRVGAEVAHCQNADGADAVGEICAQEEDLQEGIKRLSRETSEEVATVRAPLVLQTQEGVTELQWDDLDVIPNQARLAEALSDLGSSLTGLLEEGWSPERCNALIQESWDEKAPPQDSLLQLLRRARAAV